MFITTTVTTHYSAMVDDKRLDSPKEVASANVGPILYGNGASGSFTRMTDTPFLL